MKKYKEHSEGITHVTKEHEDKAFAGLTSLGKNFHGTAKPNFNRR